MVTIHTNESKKFEVIVADRSFEEVIYTTDVKEVNRTLSRAYEFALTAHASSPIADPLYFQFGMEENGGVLSAELSKERRQ